MDSLEGSNDSLGKKQRKCSLSFESIAEIRSESLTKIEHIEELPANTLDTQEYITNHSADIKYICNQGAQIQSTLNELRQKRTELEDWIKRAFEVDDLEQQIYLLNAKRRFSEVSTGDDEANNNVKIKEEGKPKLRLKLTSDTAAQGDPSGAEAVSHGRGAKNLGRMSRPQETAAVDLKPRVPNQVPIATFWNFIEQFFKRIDENDVKFLDDPNRVVDPTPFTIPPLGKHYLEQWREQYGYSSMSVGMRPLGNNFNAVSLKDRLLSMLIIPDDCADVSISDDAGFAEPGSEQQPEQPKYSCTLDARLRRELADAGFLDAKLAARDYQEDDELCLELRRLHSKLRSVTISNQYRKKRLASYIREQVLPAQELYQLVDEIDKQLTSGYIKALRVKKRGSTSGKKTSSEGSGDTTRLISNRSKLLSAFGEAVGPRSTYLTSISSKDMFDAKTEERLVKEANEHILWSSI